MNPIAVERPDYSQLISGGEVHSSVYTSEDIYRTEIEQIFQHCWVFVAHDSELPELGDYCLKDVGGLSLIVSRGDDNKIRIFKNRCRHRGSMVCHSEEGNANFFRCPFHGWTYKNTGDLAGVPYPSRYENLDRDPLGLDQVAEVEVYKGFIFARIKPGYEVSLADHLGEAAGLIDAFVGASPNDRLVVRSGSQKGKYRGNWKYVGMDGYHPNFVHKSVLELQRLAGNEGTASGRTNTDKSPNRSWALGNGHARLDFTPTKDADFSALLSAGTESDPLVQDHIQRLIQAKGEEAGLAAFEAGQDPHLHVWPNLQLISVHIRVVNPLAQDLTRVDVYPALLDGASPELNARRLRAHEYFYGPLGFGQVDDYEIFERIQEGLKSEVWLPIKRGAHDESTRGEARFGNITDEVPQRGQLEAWVGFMNRSFNE